MTGRKTRKEPKEAVKEVFVARCSFKRAVAVALLLTVVGYVVHTAEALLTMEYYLDPAYFSVWSTIMMPEAGPPPAEFTYLSLLFGFAAALIYVWAYKLVEPGLIEADGWLRKGAYFGVLLFLVGVLPGSLSLYLLINLPAILIAWWALSGFVIALLDGIIIARLC